MKIKKSFYGISNKLLKKSLIISTKSPKDSRGRGLSASPTHSLNLHQKEIVDLSLRPPQNSHNHIQLYKKQKNSMEWPNLHVRNSRIPLFLQTFFIKPPIRKQETKKSSWRKVQRQRTIINSQSQFESHSQQRLNIKQHKIIDQ